jgi:hypothetical protein
MSELPWFYQTTTGYTLEFIHPITNQEGRAVVVVGVVVDVGQGLSSISR